MHHIRLYNIWDMIKIYRKIWLVCIQWIQINNCTFIKCKWYAISSINPIQWFKPILVTITKIWEKTSKFSSPDFKYWVVIDLNWMKSMGSINTLSFPCIWTIYTNHLPKKSLHVSFSCAFYSYSWFLSHYLRAPPNYRLRILNSQFYR